MERRGKNDFGDHRGQRGGGYNNSRGGKGYNTSSHASGAPESVLSKFNCPSKMVSHFSDQDPLNPNNTLEGWICKADGPFFGSIYIHKLNGDILDEPQIIYGVPKINNLPTGGEQDARGKSNPMTQLPTCSGFFLANKWNGFSVTAYKYSDSRGIEYVSIKPRGHAFVKNLSASMATLDIVRKAFKLPSSSQTLMPDTVPSQLSILAERNVQSVTFEICGTEEPQLVVYQFPLEAKPLFVGRKDGSIVPYVLAKPPFKKALSGAALQHTWTAQNIQEDFGPAAFDASLLKGVCGQFRFVANQLNEEYRKQKARPVGLYFNNFVVEGKVLYLLDNKGACISRETGLYKVKPKDIAASHWPIFDSFLQARALEALEKIYSSPDGVVSAKVLQKEMDLSDKEWEKFSENIMNFVDAYPDPRKADPDGLLKMVIMVGLPGSGKSTVSTRLAAAGWCRVNQDEMGTRQVCEDVAARALKSGQNVVVDRCNFDFSQRAHFIKMAVKFGVTDLRCVFLDVPADVCKARVSVRVDHPTIPMGDSGVAIIDNFGSMLVPPRRGEGFNEIFVAHNEEESNAVADKLLNLAR